MDARKRLVKCGSMSGRRRQPSSGATSRRPISSSSTCGDGSTWTCRARHKATCPAVLSGAVVCLSRIVLYPLSIGESVGDAFKPVHVRHKTAGSASVGRMQSGALASPEHVRLLASAGRMIARLSVGRRFRLVSDATLIRACRHHSRVNTQRRRIASALRSLSPQAGLPLATLPSQPLSPSSCSPVFSSFRRDRDAFWKNRRTASSHRGCLTGCDRADDHRSQRVSSVRQGANPRTPGRPSKSGSSANQLSTWYAARIAPPVGANRFQSG